MGDGFTISRHTSRMAPTDFLERMQHDQYKRHEKNYINGLKKEAKDARGHISYEGSKFKTERGKKAAPQAPPTQKVAEPVWRSPSTPLYTHTRAHTHVVPFSDDVSVCVCVFVVGLQKMVSHDRNKYREKNKYLDQWGPLGW